jgi:hypothetical protein
VITYLWVRHKRENKREVALADELIEDELIEDENGIIVTRRNYQTSTHNVFPDEVRSKTDKLSPKNKMKVHTLEEPIGYSGENVMSEEEAEVGRGSVARKNGSLEGKMVIRGGAVMVWMGKEREWERVRGHYR